MGDSAVGQPPGGTWYGRMNDAPIRMGLGSGRAFPLELAALLLEAAFDSVRESVRDAQRSRRPKRGKTLRPGTDTPLWNSLVLAVNAQFTRYGDKARLGRVLGLPRQRIYEIFRRRRHLPDAERTLLLLIWLQARRAGQDLG
jgi:hypothetical protein